MNDAARIYLLRIVLRVVAVGFLAALLPWIALILTRAPALAPGGSLAPILRFQPYNAAYESMMAAVLVPWAVLLWRASSDPASHRLFIEFTIWSNAAHAAVMIVATPAQKGVAMAFVEAVPLFIIAAAVWWFRPRRVAAEAK